MEHATIKKAVIVFLVVAYFIFPTDILPDFLGPLGRIDDILFLILVIHFLFFKPLLDFFLTKKYQKPSVEEFPEQDKKDSIDPYEILEISPDATLEDAKKAYREKIKKYHPDRVNGMGEEIISVASKMTEKLNRAFKEIKLKKEKQ